MDDRRELYKTNGLSNARLCAEKRENFLKNRKEKRSAAYDRRRTVVILSGEYTYAFCITIDV